MSANDLALYMESSEAAKLSIIRRNKYPSTYIVTPYQDAKKWIVKFLTDDSRNQTTLVSATEYFQQVAIDPAVQEMKRDDAKRSINVIEAFWEAQNALGLRKLFFKPLPNKLGPLVISGVKVSTTLDALSHQTTKGQESVGGVILRLNQVEESEAAKSKRDAMGFYASTLAYMQMLDKKPTQQDPTAKICLAIDVQNKKTYEAKAGSRRISDLNAACKMIASVWPSV